MVGPTPSAPRVGIAVMDGSSIVPRVNAYRVSKLPDQKHPHRNPNAGASLSAVLCSLVIRFSIRILLRLLVRAPWVSSSERENHPQVWFIITCSHRTLCWPWIWKWKKLKNVRIGFCSIWIIQLLCHEILNLYLSST